MAKDYTKDPRSIKYHVSQFLHENEKRIKDKKIVDLPAGNGVTSLILKKLGGNPIAFDLFPQLFDVPGLECQFADAAEGIPMEDQSVDWLICQEGIEHFSDQYLVLKEFSRVLKTNGTLVITTPNHSNLRSKLSYLIGETERFTSMMPPNETDSIWMNDQSMARGVYFGHVYLIGIQRLRLFARLAGFKIKNIRFTRLKTTSAFLMLLFYPFILLFNSLVYFKNIRKAKGPNRNFRCSVYKEVYKLAINPKILVDSHLFVEFEKISSHEEVMKSLGTFHVKGGIT